MIIKQTLLPICWLLFASYIGMSSAAADDADNDDVNNLVAAEAAKPVQSHSWENYLDLLKQQPQFMQYPSVVSSMDTVPQYLTMALAQAYSLVSRANPDYPELIPLVNHVFNIAAPNPDTIYYYVALDGNSDYRIVGERGSVYMIEFQAGYDFLGFAPKSGKNLTSATIDEFEVNDDGSFEILLSNKKPADYSGNWMRLDKRTNYMMVRQIAYAHDETDARMAIEKLGNAKAARTPQSSEDLMHAVVNYVKYSSIAFGGLNRELMQKEIVNEFVVPDWSKIGGIINQTYQHTIYRAAENEALVVSVKIPKDCKYWNIQTNDLLLQTNDFLRYQSSLNGHVQRADADGITRLVLSHRDPGVANWVDLNGVEHGYLIMRWFACGDPVPSPVVKQLAFSELMNYLPADTKKVSPKQRDQDLREMRTARQLRRYW